MKKTPFFVLIPATLFLCIVILIPFKVGMSNNHKTQKSKYTCHCIGYMQRCYLNIVLLKKEMNLTEDQITEIYAINGQFAEKYMAFEGNYNLIIKFTQEHRTALNKILQFSQRNKLSDLCKRRIKIRHLNYRKKRNCP